MDPDKVIDAIYNERMAFLKTLHTWNTYKNGWTTRCTNGRMLAHSMVKQPVPSMSIWEQLINLLMKLFSKGTK